MDESTTIILLSKSKLLHHECIKECLKQMPYLKAVKANQIKEAKGAVIVDRFCDEFLTLSLLHKEACKRQVETNIIIYALTNEESWNLQAHEMAPGTFVMEKPPGQSVADFVNTLH